MDTNTYIENWLDTLAASGRKPITIKTYRKDIDQCLRVLSDGGRSTSPFDICPDDFVYLRENLTQKEEVRRDYMRILAKWVMFHTGQDPMKSANLLFNREQRNRVFISDEDFATLYENANPTMRLAIILGGMMGLRRAEMCMIRDEDIRAGYITIHGKGHGGNGLTVRLRMPRLVEEEVSEYRVWKNTRPNSGDGYLLQNGTPLSGMSVAGFSNSFGHYSRKLGVTATLHSLRRYFATTIYNTSQADIVLTAKMMRHASTSTTAKCYLDCSDSREREVRDRLDDYIDNLIRTP